MTKFDEIKIKFAKSKDDKGSIEVQVVDMTSKIENLVKHLDDNKKDFSSKRGLLNLVSKRRRFLKYLKKENETRYKEIISDLGLRK